MESARNSGLSSVMHCITLTLTLFFLPGSVATGGNLPDFRARPEAARQPPQVLSVTPYMADEVAGHYREIAGKSGGLYYCAVDRPLIGTITQLLQQNLVPGTDVVFVIDHTSSMEDDIDEVSRELRTIVNELSAQPNVQAGIVSFSDVKSGSRFGYRAQGLSTNFESIGAFLDQTELLGSVEDIYGAIWKTVDQFKWKSNTKRMIVLISDEKPATGEDTNFTLEEVMEKCAKAGVGVNVYPIQLDKYARK